MEYAIYKHFQKENKKEFFQRIRFSGELEERREALHKFCSEKLPDFKCINESRIVNFWSAEGLG